MKVEIFAIGQGEPQNRRQKKLKHGGGKAHNRSNDWTTVTEGTEYGKALSAAEGMDWQRTCVLHIYSSL